MFGFFKRFQRRKPQGLRACALFDGLSDSQFAELAPFLEPRSLGAGELLVREGEPAEKLFILTRGTLEVLKTNPRSGREHSLALLEPGDLVGDVALFDRLPRSASVRAPAVAEVQALPFAALRPGSSGSGKLSVNLYQRLLENLAATLALRFRDQSVRAVESAERRALMGNFIVRLLILVCLYTFLLSGLEQLGGKLVANTSYISIPLQLIFGVGAWRFIRSTKRPLSEFGLSHHNLIGSLLESVLFTVPVLGLLIAIKWVALKLGGSDYPLIEFPDVAARLSESRVLWLLGIYAVSSAVQELIVRSALQSSLEGWLTGPRRVWNAVLVSALLFSITHLHMSFHFAALAFLPGLFWGWLFARRRNLLGVTLSHVAVGGFVFFILGVRI